MEGCVKDHAEIEKKILENDPSFQKILDSRNSLRDELNNQKTGFMKKKQEIDMQISSLRGKKTEAKRMYSSSVERIKRQLYPRRRELERELMEMQRRYKLKSGIMGDVDRDIMEISTLIKKKDDLALTQEEIKTWNDRLSLFLEKKAALGSEKDKLKTDIEITKLKISVLEL